MTEAERTPPSALSPVQVPVAPTPMGYRLAKRSIDLAFSVVGLAVASPALLVIGLAVRLESPGPILFRQRRLGIGGKPFTVFKFRTMHASADEEAHRRYVRRLIGHGDMSEATWVPLSSDPRVTRIGRIPAPESSR